MYDNLPETAKARYLTGKKLAGIESTDTGVVVICEDGSSYSGTVVLGADGVHSSTRRQMRKLAIAEDPSHEETWDHVMLYKTDYQCLIETQSTDKSVMYISGTEHGWIFLYEELPETTGERITFSNEQLEEFAARFAEWPVTETLKVKDVYKERFNVGGAGLEEDICKNWSRNGRVVIVGDAAHKSTPNAGLCFNNEIQDVVVLCNKRNRFHAAFSPPFHLAGLEHIVTMCVGGPWAYVFSRRPELPF
ncbi:hypothetical protein LY76DRAFT_603819 [Colletotrichum caudatum]|nr:hypothetical protein LY76DRAFT_603819 [Colletotrichum caudatum]